MPLAFLTFAFEVFLDKIGSQVFFLAERRNPDQVFEHFECF
jgi:hypothetical protein